MKYPKVIICHQRPLIGCFEPAKSGGRTVIHLEIRKGVFYSGVAYCWKGDTYDKRKGKSIAFGRLMKALHNLSLHDAKQTYDWILSEIGKVDVVLVCAAFDGEKIE